MVDRRGWAEACHILKHASPLLAHIFLFDKFEKLPKSTFSLCLLTYLWANLSDKTARLQTPQITAGIDPKTALKGC